MGGHHRRTGFGFDFDLGVAMSRKASGLKAWAIQRVTAIYVGLFALYLLLILLVSAPDGYAAWRDWFAAPSMGIATLVFVISVLMHAWVGIRDVLIDYVKPIAVRATLLSLLALGLLACGLWAAQALILVRLV
jgi:succinate dehydrogenase / fumarate reductase membrane anchor subunit